MTAAATLSPREVAELLGASRHTIEKAIEERVLSVELSQWRLAGRGGCSRHTPSPMLSAC